MPTQSWDGGLLLAPGGKMGDGNNLLMIPLYMNKQKVLRQQKYGRLQHK
jgi:hypothetical protein